MQFKETKFFITELETSSGLCFYYDVNDIVLQNFNSKDVIKAIEHDSYIIILYKTPMVEYALIYRAEEEIEEMFGVPFSGKPATKRETEGLEGELLDLLKSDVLEAIKESTEMRWLYVFLPQQTHYFHVYILCDGYIMMENGTYDERTPIEDFGDYYLSDVRVNTIKAKHAWRKLANSK